MNGILTLVLGVILFFLLLAVFLWSMRYRWAKKGEEPRLDFNEEVAEELAVHALEPEPKPEPVPLSEMELPKAYGIDRLILMVRDPHWLYAYWEISATKQEEFDSNFGVGAWNSSRPVLRVYEVAGEEFNGSNAISYTDIGIGEENDNWYINVGKPNRTFCVDLGRIFPDGRFVTLLRSNTVTTPRESLSECLDEEWMWIEGIYNALNKVPYGMSSPLMLERMGRRKGLLPLGISSPGVSSPGAIQSEK